MEDRREKMENRLNEILRLNIARLRLEKGLTQIKIAEKLEMAPRSYASFKGGDNGCSALTAVLIIFENNDREAFLSEIENELRKSAASEKVQYL